MVCSLLFSPVTRSFE